MVKSEKEKPQENYNGEDTYSVIIANARNQVGMALEDMIKIDSLRMIIF